MSSGKTFEEAFENEFGMAWIKALPYISNTIAAQLNQQVKS
jgi:hypothetical protein